MAEKIRLTKSVMVSLDALVRAITLTISEGHVKIVDVDIALSDDVCVNPHECGDEVGTCRLCSIGLSHRHGKFVRTVKCAGKYRSPSFYGQFKAECTIWLIRRSGVKGGESRFVHKINTYCDRNDNDGGANGKVYSLLMCLYDARGQMSLISR